MSTVDHVALWAGLIASIVSIVLSFVAIVFAVLVDRSSRQVSIQTIKSLQKIESDVDRVSTDTRELIKAGWDKLLGSVQGPPLPEAAASAKEIAGGIAAELRADLAGSTDRAEPGSVERLDALLSRLESTLSAQLQIEAGTDRASTSLDQSHRLLEGLSPEGRALAMEIATYHLTRRQYLDLLRGPLAGVVHELREAGVLVPVKGADAHGRDIPVYYYPARLASALKAVAPLVSPPSDQVCEATREQLRRVGYEPRERRSGPTRG